MTADDAACGRLAEVLKLAFVDGLGVRAIAIDDVLAEERGYFRPLPATLDGVDAVLSGGDEDAAD